MAKDPIELLWARSKKEPMSKILGLEVLDIKPGFAKVAMEFKPQMINIFGKMHGGAVFWLLDEAFQLACNAHGQVAVALQLSINYLAPASMGARLIAEVDEANATRKTALYDAKVYEEDGGRGIAKAQALAYRMGIPLPIDENGELMEPRKEG